MAAPVSLALPQVLAANDLTAPTGLNETGEPVLARWCWPVSNERRL